MALWMSAPGRSATGAGHPDTGAILHRPGAGAGVGTSGDDGPRAFAQEFRVTARRPTPGCRGQPERTRMDDSIRLQPYEGAWPPEDPDAGFRRMVAEYSRIDPLPTLEVLSRNKQIPLGALARFILARYGTSGSDALLEIGPRVVRQMGEIVREAEAAGSDDARRRGGGPPPGRSPR